MIDPHIPVHQSERIAARVIDGKAVIIVIDGNRLHTLNEVGTFVWQHSDGRSVQAIAEALSDDFEVDLQTALRDTGSFVTTLADLGALKLSPPPETDSSEPAPPDGPTS